MSSFLLWIIFFLDFLQRFCFTIITVLKISPHLVQRCPDKTSLKNNCFLALLLE
uniref:Uncharacterized protein n=1 Tax=Rhizophora mucronata TaxID=61149 RepID=A0A2P2J2S7_RHIMU